MSTISGFGNILNDLGHLFLDLARAEQGENGAKFHAPRGGHCHEPTHNGAGGTAPKSGFNATASTTGDPHNDVVNEDASGNKTSEEKYDFQGQAGNTYNMVYDPSTGFAENATYKAYTNPGTTVVSQEGLQFDGNELKVAAGANGKEDVYLNGQKVGNGSYLNGEVTVSDDKVTVKADNFSYEIDGRGSGSNAYLDTYRTLSNAGNSRLGLGGVVGSVIANPKASTDSATLSQDQVSGLFSNAGQNGDNSIDLGDIFGDLGNLFQALAQLEGTLQARA